MPQQKIFAPLPRVLASAAALALSLTVSADDLFLTTDTPTPLGGTFYLAQQVASYETATGDYALHFNGLLFGMTPDVNIDALVIVRESEFIFSTDAPFTDGITQFQPSDIVRFRVEDNGFSLFLSGASLGLGPSANIDALAVGRRGQLLASFDAPVTVGPDTFLPQDVVRIQPSGLTLHFSGSAAGIAPSSNVVGYDEAPDGRHFFMFDVPTQLGASTVSPGDVVELDGVTSTIFYSDPALPSESAGSGFSLSPEIFVDGFESGDTSAW